MSKHLLETHIQIQPLPPRSHTFLFPTQLQTLQSRKSFTTKKSSFCLSLCNNKKNSFFFSHVSVVRSSVTRGVNEVEEDKQHVVKKAYPFLEIEPKWQRYWEENRTFRTPDEIDTSKPKFYVLDMFPYPRSLFFLSNVISFFDAQVIKNVKEQRPIFLFTLCL